MRQLHEAETNTRIMNVSRQQTRAELRRKHFRRIASAEQHIVREMIGRNNDGPVYRTVDTLPLRAERRKLARAFAAKDWNDRKAVA